MNGISGGGGGGGWGGMPGVWELSEWDQKIISFMVANILNLIFIHPMLIKVLQ